MLCCLTGYWTPINQLDLHMLRINLLISTLLLSLSFGALAKDIRLSQLDFDVVKRVKRVGSIYYSFSSFSSGLPENSALSMLDVERLALKRDSRMFLSKSAVLIDRNINDLDFSVFNQQASLKRIIGARSLSKKEESGKWSTVIPVITYRVKADLEIRTFTPNVAENNLFYDYGIIAAEFDQNFPAPHLTQVAYIDNFSVAFKQMIVINKYIPYKGKTLIISYSIGQVSQSWWKRYNLFNIATKKTRKLLLGFLKNTIEVI
jgi:hypothetical protein